MENNKEQDDDYIPNKIKIFSSEDEKLKILGELLSNKSSRDIIKLLIEKEMYTNEIAKKLSLKVSLVIHHVQKMEAIGLLEITKKNITKKGEMHRFLKIPSGMLIFPKQSEEEINNGILKKIFKKGIKFAIIGITGIGVMELTSNKKTLSDMDQFSSLSDKIGVNSEPIMYGLTVIISGLIIMYFLEKKKK